MKIGELAERAGCTVKAIRHYERIGLLSPPERTAAGYRDYDDDALARLEFVKAAKSIGLSLGEIAEIVSINQRDDICAHVLSLISSRIQEIDETVSRLLELRAGLATALADGQRLDPAECSPDAVCHIIPRGSHLVPRAS